jgi:mannosylglycoprotein endo-beta-mannosidase
VWYENIYTHAEKAPGPDGFIGGFFKKCWSFIRHDLLAAMNQMHSLKRDNWRLLNSASIVLLPKKNDAVEAKEYRPVSLMHSAAKILCKMMANRLAPELQHLVSPGQSAFIKGRSIQDNFLYVRNVIKKAHKTKLPLVFLKLDIAKAFDSLKWGYLLRVLRQMGFGQRWRNILSLLLSSTSSRIMLNGKLGPAFKHKRGLRQGDPLSPMLFILAMEPLQCLLEHATEQEVLSPLNLRVARLRASFYADDAALFVNPRKEDISAVQHILKLFGDVSGLRTSLEKCVAYPVACDGLDMANMKEICPRGNNNIVIIIFLVHGNVYTPC